MFERKYTNYSVECLFLNGEKEKISYTDFHSNSYKEMLELYSQTKEKYKNHCVTIKFKGKTKTGELEIIFQKEIITEDKAINQEETRIEELSAYQALENLNKAIEDIEKVKTRVNSGVSVFDKNQDLLLHALENEENVSMLDKIQMYDSLKKIRVDRRDNKESHNVIINFENILKAHGVKYNMIQADIKNVLGRQDKYANENKHENLTKEQNKNIQDKMYQTVKYRSYKERDIIMDRLNSMYTKTVDNTSEMSILCYNKCAKMKK